MEVISEMLPVYMSIIDDADSKDYFEKIYYEHRKKLFSIAFRILKNKDDAEDALNITFMRVAQRFTKISQFPCHVLRKYLVIIVRNVSFTIYRQNQKAIENLDELSEELPNQNDHALFSNEQIEALKEALPKLPQIYKDVLVMYYYMAMTSKEIAKHLNISEANVCTRLSRARERLRKLMEDDNND